jgi:hypothetical protein
MQGSAWRTGTQRKRTNLTIKTKNVQALRPATAQGLAALPASGPLDVIGDSGTGALDWDLRTAALQALAIPTEICRAHALRFSWRASIQQFLANLVPGADGGSPLERVEGTAISSCDRAKRFASTPCP